MADDSARIRRCEAADEKLVRFIIGKAAFEPLAVANRWAYVHPIFLGVWFALAVVMVQYMNWWPSNGPSILKILSPLPAFAAMAVPLMFFVDWFNRGDVEGHAQEIIRRRDAIDVARYYSNTSGSALWIIEYGKNFVGLIAVDAKGDDQEDKKKSSNSPATKATIRHFFVDEPYRSTGIQDDLLTHAIRHTFETSSIETIKTEGNPLVPYVQGALLSAKFVPGSKIKSLGLFRWPFYEMELDRTRWKATK